MTPVKRFLVRSVQALGAAAALATVLTTSGSAEPQFLPFPAVPGHIVEGNWQSCPEADGRYAERIYDHIVNGVPQFEVHLGPRREFAIFKGVQDEHRAHTSAENLLKPFTVPMDRNRAKHQWDVPSLNVTFSVTLGGGSPLDCESWYVLLEEKGKPSQ